MPRTRGVAHGVVQATRIPGCGCPVHIPASRSARWRGRCLRAVVTLTSDGNGTFPTAWTRVGGFTAAGPPSAAVDPATGRTRIAARGEGGLIHHTGEETQGSGAWGPWTAASAEQAATDPTAFSYSSGEGPAWGFVFRTDDDRTYLDEARDGTLRGHALPVPPQR